jgi:hypothetical protein
MTQKEFAKFLYKNKATILLLEWNEEVGGLNLVLRKVTGRHKVAANPLPLADELPDVWVVNNLKEKNQIRRIIHKLHSIWTVSFDKPLKDDGCDCVAMTNVMGYSTGETMNIDGLLHWLQNEGDFCQNKHDVVFEGIMMLKGQINKHQPEQTSKKEFEATLSECLRKIIQGAHNIA